MNSARKKMRGLLYGRSWVILDLLGGSGWIERRRGRNVIPHPDGLCMTVSVMLAAGLRQAGCPNSPEDLRREACPEWGSLVLGAEEPKAEFN
jgi:hypothetical protein